MLEKPTLASIPARAKALHAAALLHWAGGQNHRALRLLAAVDAQLRSMATRLLPGDQQAFERCIAQLRSDLDSATVGHVWAEGQTLSVDSAIEDALKD